MATAKEGGLITEEDKVPSNGPIISWMPEPVGKLKIIKMDTFKIITLFQSVLLLIKHIFVLKNWNADYWEFFLARKLKRKNKLESNVWKLKSY